MSGPAISTTDGDMSQVEFLEELLEQLWPYAADDVDFSFIDDSNVTVSVTYGLEPFGISKTIDYEVSVYPNELRVSCLDSIPLDGVIDIKELAKTLDSQVYEDFRDGLSW